jgi:hypothetical protein
MGYGVMGLCPRKKIDMVSIRFKRSEDYSGLFYGSIRSKSGVGRGTSRTSAFVFIKYLHSIIKYFF